MEAQGLPDNRLSRLLLLYILPFSYGAATRVPFVFASLHCVLVLGTSLPTLAGVLGCYQVFRILGNYCVGALGPRVALPCGAAAGLLGYSSMAVATALAPSAVGPGVTTACLALVGLSETITALQFFCKKTYAANPVMLRSNLLRLYACNVSGTCVAFLVSALLYDRYGITGSACFGAGLEASLLLGSLGYLALCASKQCASKGGPRYDVIASVSVSNAQLKHTSGHNVYVNGYNPFAAAAKESLPEETHELEATQAEAGLGADSIALQLSRPMSLHSSRQSGDDQTLSLHASLLLDSNFVIPEDSPACADGDTGFEAFLPTAPTSGAASMVSHGTKEDTSAAASADTLGVAQDRAPWVNYVLAWTFCVQAVLIGTILSTAPLLLHDALGLGVLHVGFAFAAGEALGSAALLFNSTQAGQAVLRRLVPLPLGLLLVLSCMGLLAISLPLCVHPMVALANLVLIMGLNDVGTSMTGECQGASLPERHFSEMNVLGNMLRRLGNTVTCALGPLVYQVNMRAPFVVFGTLLLVWVVLLTALLALRARQVARGSEEVSCRSARSAITACTSMYGTRGAISDMGNDLRRYCNQSFITQERGYWSQGNNLIKKAA